MAHRLSLLVTFMATLVFLVALGYMAIVSRRAVREEAIAHATELLNTTTLRVNSILEKVIIATDNIEWLVKRHMDAPDSMYVYSKRILMNNPDLIGCSIAFEPYYFKEKGHYYSVYSMRKGDEVFTEQEGNSSYQYFYLDWYLQAKLRQKACWTEPFDDFTEGQLSSEQTIVSYCKPLYDNNQKFAGIISVDIALSWLSQTISAVKPYPNSYSIMLGKGGTYFVHPDSTMLSRQTIFTQTLEHANPDIYALGKAMTNGEEGMMELPINGKNNYVFYQPLGNTGWSTAIICPESDIFAGYLTLQRIVFFIIVIGLLLMMSVLAKILSHELKPLGVLARHAETIAGGRFSDPMPPATSFDEIGKLTQSFSNMQESLVKYIDELTVTTAKKERMEGELNIARKIQMAMVPRVFPAFPDRNDIDLYAFMMPAREVGGDLYDYFIKQEKLYFCLGDVSGKGIPASLVMAVTRNLFRIVAQQELPPAEIAKQINDTLAEENDQDMFITMIIGMLNLKTGRLDFCNCGHNPPIMKGAFLSMEPNLPLALMKDIDFVGESIENVNNEMILFYTDGVNEAVNNQHEQFGDNRLLDFMCHHPDTAQETVMGLKEAVSKFVTGAEPSDDLTMLCIKLKK